MRGDADLSGVLNQLPGLLEGATNYAHSIGQPDAWALVADIYSTVYWLAERHRRMDLADLAVTDKKTAAARRSAGIGHRGARRGRCVPELRRLLGRARCGRTSRFPSRGHQDRT